MIKANLLAQAVFTAASLLCITSFTQEARSADLNRSVEAYGSYVLYHWNKDEKLRNHPAPQIITDLDPNTKILGACVSNYNGKLSTDIGGTSYCKRSNTIYVVQSQIAPLYKHFVARTAPPFRHRTHLHNAAGGALGRGGGPCVTPGG